jgi:cytochrome c556
LGFVALSVAALAVGGAALVSPAAAQDDPVVKQRQAVMDSNGAQVYRVIPDFVRSGKGTAEDVAKGAAIIVENSKKLPTLFPAGTSVADLPGKTRAKPEIWQDKAKFEAIAKTMGERAEALEAAAKGGDKAKIGEAYTALNRDGCNACHNAFRAPEAPRGGG